MAINGGFETAIEAVQGLVGTEKLEFANLLFSATNEIGDFGPKHNVIKGVRKGNQIPILTQGNNYGALSATLGNCSMNECDFTDTYSTKEWVLGTYDCRIPVCLETYSEDFKLFWGMYSAKIEDPQNESDKSKFLAYLADKGQRYVQGALWRTSYLGDTTSVNGLIKANNGFFTEADGGDGDKIEMTFTNAAGKRGEEIYNYMLASYEDASAKDWFDESKVKFRVTRKVARELVSWLNTTDRTNQYGAGFINADKAVAKGVYSVDNLTILGIPVISYKEVDEAGKAIGVQPDYKILLVADDNMLVGVETESHMNQFRVFYVEKDNKIYIDMRIQIGTAIPLDEYVYLTEKVG